MSLPRLSLPVALSYVATQPRGAVLSVARSRVQVVGQLPRPAEEGAMAPVDLVRCDAQAVPHQAAKPLGRQAAGRPGTGGSWWARRARRPAAMAPSSESPTGRGPSPAPVSRGRAPRRAGTRRCSLPSCVDRAARRPPARRPELAHHSPGVSPGAGIMPATSTSRSTGSRSQTSVAVKAPSECATTTRSVRSEAARTTVSVYSFEAGGVVVARQVHGDDVVPALAQLAKPRGPSSTQRRRRRGSARRWPCGSSGARVP